MLHQLANMLALGPAGGCVVGLRAHWLRHVGCNRCLQQAGCFTPLPGWLEDALPCIRCLQGVQ